MKHAYLIVAHNNLSILKILLKLLDDPRNDIYLHIGKDVKNVDLNQLVSISKKSNIYLSNKRFVITWGSRSQIDVTMHLLQQAKTNGNYSYYHLLSGVDLPIKSQDYIHRFFQENNHCEFISFDPKFERTHTESAYNKIIGRIKYYHFLRNINRHRGGIFDRSLNILEYASIATQKIIGINRIKNSDYIFYKGSNWFSISEDLVTYLLSKKEYINNLIQYSFCADEIFLHTIVMNSPYKTQVSGTSIRYIDWTRGSPYTFRIDNLEELKKSDKLFARKFDEDVNYEIVIEIEKMLQ